MKSTAPKTRLRDFLYRCAHYLCVCRCIACGEIIAEDEVFCEACAEEFSAALLSECGVCGKSLSRCLCTERTLERGGIHKHVKLYRYLSDDPDAVGNRILYRLKKNDVSTCFRFLGGKLAECAARLLPIDENYVVTYVPRTKKRVLKHGFDQSARLAKEVSVSLGLRLIHPLKRTYRALMQKSLHSTAARRENVKRSLLLRKNAEKSFLGKRVLLLDDIVTSGASMAEAAKLLKKAGAREVVALSVAVVTRTRNLALEARQNSRMPFYMR